MSFEGSQENIYNAVSKNEFLLAWGREKLRKFTNELDAHNSYSPIIHVSDMQNDKTSVYPNPATSFVWLKLTNAKPQNYQLCIYNTDGKTPASRSLDLEPGSLELKISLPAGYYKHFLLTLTDENGSRQTFKMAKV